MLFAEKNKKLKNCSEHRTNAVTPTRVKIKYVVIGHMPCLKSQQ